MTGYQSWTIYRKDITHLRQYYDFTYHLYNKEISEIIKMRSEKKESFFTEIGATCHSVDALYNYTQKQYPNKLRELILISLISSTENYFVSLLEEAYCRDKDLFKHEDIVELHKSELLSFNSIRSLEKKIIKQDLRKITSGGVNIAIKCYKKALNIDFNSLGVSLKQYLEYFDRRHLIVHANGYVDEVYFNKYTKFIVGEKIQLPHTYIIDGFNIFYKLGLTLRNEVLKIIPENIRKKDQVIGECSIADKEIYIIEFYLRKAKENIDKILNRKILFSDMILKNIIIKYFIEDINKVVIIISLKEVEAKYVMPTFKGIPCITELSVSKIS
ncbi:hypothetical protein TRIP_E70021 [uncultured Spirochaetota bacterium]|jgi:hypothetical protein|nr:hypothetical protein TRIP_E70021 [uncultured Spirochaetota bacterium]